MGFGYDISVMILWLSCCPQWLMVLIVGFGYDVSVMILWLFSYFILFSCEPKDYIYIVACEV